MSSAWDKEKILSPYEESNLRPVEIRSSEVRFFMGTQNFSLSHAGDKTKKNIFLYFLTRLKTDHLSYPSYEPVATFSSFSLLSLDFLSGEKCKSGNSKRASRKAKSPESDNPDGSEPRGSLSPKQE